ncbi:OLC1v1015780C1 [Oldenlandia corymbosa var. corymbosa]|uniref:OLC1v1015780C1 n=1 Tax=Oldenlandia corymbosa var. corymbosa TaxID=529605 RepID=A0AAV1E3X4_OLDCO|nr:OLC1v1015780C1 [Oldenlandia corymbosa var. corymbosa]
MTASTSTELNASEVIETPFLVNDTVEDNVDYKGCPVKRSESGGWRSAAFIIGLEISERIAFCGIGSNLINYLTGSLGQSTATAAANVNAWSGAASLLPLLGGFVADSFFGRYRTILIASLLFILGLGFLTLSAVLPSFSSADCQNAAKDVACFPSELRIGFFFFSLYLVALAEGGHRPCVQAFGADQFDGRDPTERRAKSSFFNWWYFGMCGGSMITFLVLNYIQDNLGWGLGFGIPCVAMAVGLILFLFGTKTYRFRINGDEMSPFLRIGRVFVKAGKNWRASSSAISIEEESLGFLPYEGSQQFKFLNKALLARDNSKEDDHVCSITDVEEAKAVLRLFPIWATGLVYGIMFSQPPTFFTKQGVTMDRSISPSVQVPAASLLSFMTLSIMIFIPIYDRVLVPIARSVSGRPSGLTTLQRVGTGIVLSCLTMVIAALVEMKRLETAKAYGLVDNPKETIPMSVAWLIPQYFLFGVADTFISIGLQEFFYDQVPSDLKSIGLALYLSVFGFGNFLSSFLISVIEKATGGDGRDSWFSDNLNKAHLDYFYWLLSALSAVSLITYLYFTQSHIYNRASNI